MNSYHITPIRRITDTHQLTREARRYAYDAALAALCVLALCYLATGSVQGLAAGLGVAGAWLCVWMAKRTCPRCYGLGYIDGQMTCPKCHGEKQI